MEAVERVLSKSPGFMMNRTVQAIRKVWTEAIEAEGIWLTPEEFFVLVMLDAVDGLSQAEMAVSLMRDRTTVTRLLDGVVRKGLARREHPKDDRRVVNTWLTPKGREMFAATSAITTRVRRRLFGNIDPAEMEQALRTLARIRENCGEPTGGGNGAGGTQRAGPRRAAAR